jgi:hypothetical protein
LHRKSDGTPLQAKDEAKKNSTVENQIDVKKIILVALPVSLGIALFLAKEYPKGVPVKDFACDAVVPTVGEPRNTTNKRRLPWVKREAKTGLKRNPRKSHSSHRLKSAR